MQEQAKIIFPHKKKHLLHLDRCNKKDVFSDLLFLKQTMLLCSKMIVMTLRSHNRCPSSNFCGLAFFVVAFLNDLQDFLRIKSQGRKESILCKPSLWTFSISEHFTSLKINPDKYTALHVIFHVSVRPLIVGYWDICVLFIHSAISFSRTINFSDYFGEPPTCQHEQWTSCFP